jgi:hypothetical protein
MLDDSVFIIEETLTGLQKLDFCGRNPMANSMMHIKNDLRKESRNVYSEGEVRGVILNDTLDLHCPVILSDISKTGLKVEMDLEFDILPDSVYRIILGGNFGGQEFKCRLTRVDENQGMRSIAFEIDSNMPLAQVIQINFSPHC